MKITTVIQNFGKTLTVLDGKQIKFNSAGLCDVTDKMGKILLDKYPETFSDPNKVIETVKGNTFKDTVSRNFEEQIVELKSQLASRASEVKVAEADKKAWAELSIEKDVEIVSLKEALVIEIDTAKKVTEVLELKISLLEAEEGNLKKLCESSEYPKKEWKNLDKPALIEYILGKS
jgi:hypothetical protein